MQQGPLTLESPLTNQGFPLWVDLRGGGGGIFSKMHENYKHFWAKQWGDMGQAIFLGSGGILSTRGKPANISPPPPILHCAHYVKLVF